MLRGVLAAVFLLGILSVASSTNDETAVIQAGKRGKSRPGQNIPIMPIKDCKASKADIVFVLDASGSIGKANFKKVLDFTARVISGLNVAPGKIRIGLITYGRSVSVDLWLGQKIWTEAIIKVLLKVKYKSGSTRTGLALEKMRQVFSKNKRPGAKKVGIVITDGRSSDPDRTREEAYIAKNSCIKMLSIGIGKKISMNELTDIASDPVQGHVFKVKDCDSLEAIFGIVSKTICKDSGAGGGKNPVCTGQRTDLIFVVDTSGSIGSENFKILKNFLKTVVDELDVSEKKTRVAILCFSTSLYLQFPLNKYYNKGDILKAIDAIPYIGGGTNTEQALKRLLTLFSVNEGGRIDTGHVAILVTDGRSNTPSLTKAAAATARNAGITMLAVGIGNQINVQELNDIATDPDSQSVFTVSDFKSLVKITRSLGTKTCEAGKDSEKRKHKNGKSYHCSFQTSDVCGYRQEALGKLKWKWLPNRSGPCVDHTTGQKKGKYIYLDAKSNCHCSSKDAYRRLWSPRYESSKINRCLVFYYFMNGKTMGTLNVYIRYVGGTKLWRVWTKSGNQKRRWHKAEVDLKTDKDFYLAFEGIRGKGKYSDIAIDDITVGYGSCDYVGPNVCG